MTTGGASGRRHAAVRSGDRAAVVVLVVLVAAAFSPWWIGGGFFGPLDIAESFYLPWAEPGEPADVHNHFTSDAVTQYLPYRIFADSAYAADGRIGWNDLQYLGTAAWANTMAGYDDWTMQLHRWLGFSTAWHLGLALSILIAGLGMYVFLRASRCSPPIALVAAVAYAANSQFVVWLYHRFMLASFCWVPWMLWALLRWRTGAAWSWALVPVFAALAIMGGTIQTAAYVVMALGLGALTMGPPAPPTWPRLARRTGRELLPWLLVALGLASISLLGEVATYLDTVRSGQVRGSVGYTSGPLQPITSALFGVAQLAPTWLGRPGSLDVAKLLDRDLMEIAYFGTLPGLLALLGFFRRGAPATARWLVAAGLLLPLTPLVGPLYHRVQILWVVGGIWLFAWLWTSDLERDGPVVYRRLRNVWIGLLITWICLSLVALRFDAALTEVVREEVMRRASTGAGQFGESAEWMAHRAAVFVDEVRVWAPRQAGWVLAVSLGLLGLRRRIQRGPAAGAVLLGAAVVLEALVFSAGWVTVADLSTAQVYEGRDDIDRLAATAGDGAVIVFREAGTPQLFPPNLLAANGIRSLQQYESIRPVGAWQRTGFSTAIADLSNLGVAVAVTPSGVAAPAGWVHVRTESTFEVWWNPAARARYEALFPPGERGGDRAVDVRDQTPSSRSLVLPAGATGVRVAENCTRDWHARIQGGDWREAECAEDGTLTVSLELPVEAPTRVELRYAPRLQHLGRRIAAAAALAMLASTLLVTTRHGNILHTATGEGRTRSRRQR